MPDYRRRFVPGALYFFTRVTAGRQPIFADPTNVQLLREATAEAKRHKPFRIVASVVLHDHAHDLIRLPDGDTDYPQHLARIKKNFTRNFLDAGGTEARMTDAQAADGRRGVWQPRYHKHTIRDEEDFRRHLTYIHFNPVRHGLVSRPEDWPASSIHSYIRRGLLRPGWGTRPGDASEEPDPAFFGD